MFKLQVQLMGRLTKSEKIVFLNHYIKRESVFGCTSKSLFRNYRDDRGGSKRSDSIKWLLLVMPVTAFGLGCWQVRRREWKLNLIGILETNTQSTPVDLPTDLSGLHELEYYPVKVCGHFLHDQEILMGPRSLIEAHGVTPRAGSLMTSPKPNQGWLVITPFQLHDRNEKILINRGWVPASIKNPANRPQGQIEGHTELIGIVRLTEQRPNFVPKNLPHKGQWFYRDLHEMAQLTDSAPVLLDARGHEDMPAGWPIPNQTRITLRNEHMSYLITWFSLSAFTSLMWIRKFIQKVPLL